MYTHNQWLAKPQHLRQSGPLLIQPVSVRCMGTLLQFWMGAHSLPIVQGRRTGTLRVQRLCQHCDQHAIGDGCHMGFECPALQGVRNKDAALCEVVQHTFSSSNLLMVLARCSSCTSCARPFCMLDIALHACVPPTFNLLSATGGHHSCSTNIDCLGMLFTPVC